MGYGCDVQSWLHLTSRLIKREELDKWQINRIRIRIRIRLRALVQAHRPARRASSKVKRQSRTAKAISQRARPDRALKAHHSRAIKAHRRAAHKAEHRAAVHRREIRADKIAKGEFESAF